MTAAPQTPEAAPAAIEPVDPLTFTEDMPEFPPAVLEALRTPVRDEWVEERAVKEGSNATLIYVPWIHYQDVLEAAFGIGGFRLVPRSVPRTEGNQVTWLGALFVRIPGTKKFHFIDESKGECNGRLGAGNAVEGAKSDCLTKCCKRLGIFRELFDPNWRRAWERNNKAQRQQQRSAATWPTTTSRDTAPAAEPAGREATDTSAAGTSDPATSAADTGEAASPEQLDAIHARVKELAWKRGFVRDWFGAHFVRASDPVRAIAALTSMQADAAFTLLSAHGTGAYDALLAGLRAKGRCR